MGSASIIVGKSLRFVANSGTMAEDATDETGKVTIGRPVTIRGTGVQVWRVSDSLYGKVLSETDAAKRAALLTNITGKASKTGRVSVRRDVLAGFVASALAAVGGIPEGADADAATAQHRAAYATAQAWLESGIVALPAPTIATANSGTDALAALFGLAEEAEEEEEEEAEEEAAAPATGKSK